MAFFISFLFFQLTFAQEKKDSLALQFHLKFDHATVSQNQQYISKNDTLQIETFKFYISNIQIQYADRTTIKPQNSAYLIDLEVQNTQKIPIALYPKKEIKIITFDIGVDSLASVSGALSGDLDPTKGMYWAWQSGYINMKMEGNSKSCKTRKGDFKFHLGGYLKPYNALRTVVLNQPKNNKIIDVNVNIAAFFSEILLSQTNSIMIPGKRTMQLSDIAVTMFKLE